ncbi:MAG: hypothetical protein DRO06_03125 [Thermoproteota archaeon]|nr:MAG: hypothetical protein DRO06_03125 [Candidatus Korarchaeota archaeon]
MVDGTEPETRSPGAVGLRPGSEGARRPAVSPGRGLPEAQPGAPEIFLGRRLDWDVATIEGTDRGTWVVLPYRSTGLGAYRRHYIKRESLRGVREIRVWRKGGVDYLALLVEEPIAVISVWRSNRGITRAYLVTAEGADLIAELPPGYSYTPSEEEYVEVVP